MLYWPVLIKFKLMLDNRSELVFALTVQQLCKLFRLLKQRPHWYGSAEGC
jgi:hypothetical protein